MAEAFKSMIIPIVTALSISTLLYTNLQAFYPLYMQRNYS
jgi:MFS family permease